MVHRPAMTDLARTVLCFAGAAIMSGGLTAALLPLLRRRSIIDQPNARSSHTAPTPRGGGAAVVATIVMSWSAVALLTTMTPSGFPRILIGIVVLAVVSGIEDVRGLSPVTRLGWQVVAVVGGLSALGSDQMVFQGVMAPWLDRGLAALAWVWFVNLFNFMDGIDGITSVETSTIGVGVAAVFLIGDAPVAGAYLASALAGAATGFLPWNWYRARLFMGDVGSVPTGYAVGYLLILVATRSYWVAALILPSYYLVDATVTLLRRVLRGQKPWEPHRDHFYQVATPVGASHAVTVVKVLAANVMLLALAIASIWAPAYVCLAAAAIVVAVLLAVLANS